MISEKLILLFLEAIIAEKSASANTVSAYRSDLFSFLLFLNKRSIKVVNESEIEDFLVAQKKAKFSVSTLSRRLSSIRHYFKFAFQEGWTKQNPAKLIKNGPKERNLPKSLSLKEVDMLLDAARNSDCSLGRISARFGSMSW